MAKTYQCDPLIDAFLDDLWSSKGLSDNTLSAYRTDLRHFDRYQQSQGLRLIEVGQADVRAYLAYRVEQQFARTSSARLLSSLRRFTLIYCRPNRLLAILWR